jgi:hypothetical protein
MPAYVEDVSVFYQLGTPGIVAATVNGVTVHGEFRAESAYPLGDVVEATGPVFECRAASVPSIAHGQSVVVSGVTYKVRGLFRPDAAIVVAKLEAQ